MIVIIVDDMGYSDLGCFGGEIPTPNIDGLAKRGVRFTNFFNNAKCSPSRASLMTGQFPPSCGMGGSVPRPLTRCTMIPHVLKSAGYDSYMVGKWHLREHPMDWGFDHSWGLLSGADNYFEPEKRWTNEHEVTEDPDFGPDFYATEAFTEHALDYLGQAGQKENPFFMYLAYTAPHWPLQARPEDIARHRGNYLEGWDVLRRRRFERQKELGIMPPHAELSPRDGRVPAWEDVTDEDKDRWDNHMAVYAAMMEVMDRGVGQVMDKLRAMGVTEDTLVMFMSDNGSCMRKLNVEDYAGPADSRVGYGFRGANLSNVPLRKYKLFVHNGGVQTPMIAHWPNGIEHEPGTITRERAHLVDIMPTVVELSGAEYPGAYRDWDVLPMPGLSFAPTLQARQRPEREFLCWHMGGFRGGGKYNLEGAKKVILHKKYKAVDEGGWHLYDLGKDPTELHDLAGEKPELLGRMQQAWAKWLAQVEKDSGRDYSHGRDE
jgi:arylsulfatase